MDDMLIVQSYPEAGWVGLTFRGPDGKINRPFALTIMDARDLIGRIEEAIETIEAAQHG